MGFRIKDVRLSKGLSQVQLAEILNVSIASLSAWEVGTRYPPLETAVKIADKLDVSVDYLLGRQDFPTPCNSLKSMIDPRSLPAFHGNPVWLVDKELHLEEWAFVDGISRQFRLFSGAIIDIDGFTGKAFIYKPNSSVSIDHPPLEIDSMRGRQMVWVEPISGDPAVNTELRGWYSVKDRYVENEMQTRFYFWNHGSKWLAFETEVKKCR